SILMRLEYRVELPDHDWVIAKRHKLISSVYAVLDMQEGKYAHADTVTYSGPTFIRIHSSKHDSSTMYSHEKDFDDLMNKKQLRNYTTTTNEQPKPVVVLLSDGSPDENPAGDVLTSVWENTIIDSYPVLVKYINPFKEYHYPNEKSALWIEKHIMTCCYMTQVTKCDDQSYRKPFRSGIRQILPNCFFPHHSKFNKSLSESNLSVEPSLDVQDFQVDTNASIYNYRHDEVLVSNQSKDAMWVEKEIVPEDVLETYHQQVQIQEKLIADKVLIVDWDTWNQSISSYSIVYLTYNSITRKAEYRPKKPHHGNGERSKSSGIPL
ncbi:23433_t:CDS:2, partial [Racocetra persica]